MPVSALDEAKSHVGKTITPDPFLTVASRSAINMWAKAIGSRNRIYFDETYARMSSHGAIVAPHTFLYAFNDTAIHPGLPNFHAWYAEVEWAFEARVGVGDQVSAESEVLEPYDKRGGFAGDVVYQPSSTKFRNGDGKRVATAVAKVVRFDREEAARRGSYGDLKPHRYQEADLEEIEDAYLNEEIRGADVRYFESVQAGDGIGRIIRGPLTSEDVVFFVERTRPVPSYDLFTEQRLERPSISFIDEYGMPESWHATMLMNSAAAKIGLQSAHDAGYQRVAWMEDLVVNWCGDAGFIESLDVRLLAPNLYTHATWCTGTVRRKVEAGSPGSAPAVEIELEGHNQSGRQTVAGNALVRLPSTRWPLGSARLPVGNATSTTMGRGPS